MEEEMQSAPASEAAQTTAEAQAEVNVNVGKSKKSIGDAFKNYFTATRIAYIAVFTALAYILYMPCFEFVIIPAVDFLKVDFSNVFVMIAAFALGPVAGVVVGVLKEILHALTFSSTVGIGELANIIVMLPYVLIPSIIYKKHKGIKTVLWTIAVGCVGQCLISFPVNYLLNFPFYLGFDWTAGMSFFLSVWYWVMLFNLVKTILISVVVILLYKPLSRLIKITNEKFSKRKKAAQ